MPQLRRQETQAAGPGTAGDAQPQYAIGNAGAGHGAGQLAGQALEYPGEQLLLPPAVGQKPSQGVTGRCQRLVKVWFGTHNGRLGSGRSGMTIARIIDF
ncbi:MAG: hypothetical protein Kow0073_13470 [Immundisolibacter sp.]